MAFVPFHWEPKLEVIDKIFKVDKVLGRGGFGTVYLAFNKVDNSQVAIKLDMEFTSANDGAKKEAAIYKALRGVKGVPTLFGTGVNDRQNYMAMQVLGKDLAKISNEVKFSVKDVLLVAVKSIAILQGIHERGVLHHDIKPNNISIGKEDKDQLYIMDFGIASTETIDAFKRKSGERILHCGTPDYASLNCHEGKPQGKADDLECLGYVFLYLLKGKSPWNKNRSAATFRNVYPEKKLLTTIEMCEGYPHVFAAYLEYCRNLRSDEEPQYSLLIEMFQAELKELGYEGDNSFDFNHQH